MVLIVASSIVLTCGTLTANEEAALREILRNHPDLYSVPSWASTDSQGSYYGSSWNDSLSGLCQNDGYGFYGVYCVNGHVGGLRLYALRFHR